MLYNPMMGENEAKSKKIGGWNMKYHEFWEMSYSWSVAMVCVSSLNRNTADTTCNTMFIGHNCVLIPNNEGKWGKKYKNWH